METLFNKNSHSKPLIIAGPCSIETPEQLDNTVQELVSQGINLIRGGVWKPRTRPGSFEGLGSIALPWIQEIKNKYTVKFAIEVASAQHVEEALAHEIDILWVGARSTVNPFTVQEIAESLKGVNIPVMIKNPVNPDLSLWIGAVERFQKIGIQDLAVIHRGFSNFRDQIHRNSPLWQIPIEFRTHFPDLMMINDPSHISGKRDLVPIIAQKALDLNFDGLIIESHCNPDQAWSDAAQQLTPKNLEFMLSQLKTRKVKFEAAEMLNQLAEIRSQIDQADHDLLEALHRRMQLVEKIGEYKKLNNVAVLQMERWKEIFDSRPRWGESLGLNPELIQEIFGILHQESIRTQTEILDKIESNN
ncbi:MAG TPA: 3-deoxy-7-phosphoheptulonate synthase [Algoriphagus sp.]|uniref:bifunctional 3-deoxy-7-phosphoheptulonate synthase/chorismate mutase type II n=2 Tax=Algoriphagus TaxID=246875 RepID=UPI000C64D679|nr:MULTISPECIES: bifunctional 3-deoxy-7-phosphoheptulonate synthase/chorismate mutase type II [unclassified Algoriphagus]MAL14704.1 3-deoxy-7-phosphoheptulonate synthase [Algoriphagus sp.]HAD49873.1 3-deoxy-7-phosphoheptulonate synthase [Algoriphagus sp.]HAH36027.1 3-deoxy-7-phosphoheptulonate synthase [Algoriphagus sp.]HCD89111.1 3-deoxy-7-phosphoheptulonate synthase [Algoriphagus sp.]